MVDREAVIEYFDRLAVRWDEENRKDEAVIDRIFRNAGVTPGKDILDVACGTGVLFPDYMERGVRSLCGIDISPEMAKRARDKFPDERVLVINGDIEEAQLGPHFDVVMVYNAFPHFRDPKRLIKALSSYTKPGGYLSIAHGMSKEAIDCCHEKLEKRFPDGLADRISNPLPEAEELAEWMRPYIDVDVVISDGDMYQVSGIKR